MSSKKQALRHTFGGGWATDYGYSADVSPDGSGNVVFPFLVDAENVFYELDGGPHKIGGTTKLNSVAAASGAEIMGLYDFWIMGTANTPTQKRVLHAGTVIMSDQADGTFANIKTGLTDNAVPSYSTFNDVLIIGSTSTTDNPQSFDGTTCSNLAGSPPRFSFSAPHKNRVWAAGVATLPSRLYYSGNLDETDWSGATSGSIDIDPDDGDGITGIVSHKNDLWVFKGPHKGSIHRITGSAPTGADAFSRVPFIRGLGAIWHNSIFRFRDDIGFMWSDGSIHSLNATANYGDYEEAALSRPIHRYLRENVNFAYLQRCWAANLVRTSQVAITMPVGGSQFCNQVLVMDHSHQPVRWSQWPALNANCIARVIDATDSSRHKFYIGGTDGFVRKTDASDRSIDGTTSISAKVTTPFTNYGDTFRIKTASGAAVGISPKGGYNLTLGIQCDASPQQSYTVSQSGGNVLGTTSGDSNVFTLNDATLGLLGGSMYLDRFVDQVTGEFRSVQLQVTQNTTSQDVELHSISLLVEMDSLSMENI